MRIGIILLVAALMAGLTSCVKLKTDKRAAGFEKYILEQAERNAYNKCTEENMINVITSRYIEGEGFDFWLDYIKKNRKETSKYLYDYCKVIHELDREAGKDLPFDEALRIVMERPDTSANIDAVIRLQRNLHGINYYIEEIILCDETFKWEKKMKKEGKEIKLNEDLL